MLDTIVREGAAVPHLCEAAARFTHFPSVLVRPAGEAPSGTRASLTALT